MVTISLSYDKVSSVITITITYLKLCRLIKIASLTTTIMMSILSYVCISQIKAQIHSILCTPNKWWEWKQNQWKEPKKISSIKAKGTF